MNIVFSIRTRLAALAAGLALAGSVASAQASFLFTDGDFGAQSIDQAVGAPWGPVGGGNTVTADAQSPFANVYPDNGKGAHFPASSGNPYIVRSFAESPIPATSTDKVYFNVDFRNTTTDAGDYSIVITRDASGGARSVAFYVTGDSLYADSADGVEAVRTLQPGTWYNLQVVLDMASKTYSGTVASFAEVTTISSRAFVVADQVINCVYTDGGTSQVPGTAPEHDLDNWAVSDSPLAPLASAPFVKSTVPHGNTVEQNAFIFIELQDHGTQVATNTIQLSVNGESSVPVIAKAAGTDVTTVKYVPPAPWRPGSYDVRLIFGDTSTPSALQTNEFSFVVPGPTVTLNSPTGAGNRADAGIRIEVTDMNTQLATNSVQLTVNDQAVSPTIAKLPGTNVTAITYAPQGGFAPGSTNSVHLIFNDTSTPPIVTTNDFIFEVVDATAAAIVNIDFNGVRNVPGPDVLGPTYSGAGAAGGGKVFNGITADSRLSDGTDEDNLTVSAENLLNSVGDTTTVSFTVSPMGGDVGGAATTDPASTEALFSDYVFNNSAGNTAGESPFTISGLGTIPFVDLYFYHTSGGVTIPGSATTAFAGQGIFTSGNTYFFSHVPVTNGIVEGTFGSGTAVIEGMSIVSPLPRPFVKSVAPTGGGTPVTAPITIVLEDYVTQVVTNSIQLFLNDKPITPNIVKPAGSTDTTVTYVPAPGWIEGATNVVRLVFADNATPPVTQTTVFSFAVLSQAAAAVTINIDFNGARNVPGPRGPGPTFIGQGAAGGGSSWNGILANSQLEDGTDDDNLTITGTALLNSLGAATTVGFTISPVGGDDAGAPAGTDPTADAALLGDYVFVGSAGQISGMADFSISGLGAAPFIDLYFYFGANGNFVIPGGTRTAFSGSGTFTAANTIVYKNVPVTNGTVNGTLGTGPVSVMYGLTIQEPLPQPYIKSFTPVLTPGLSVRTNEVGIIEIQVQDYITQVAQSSIELTLNGQAVTPQITRNAGTGVTTISYNPFGALQLDAPNTLRLHFSDGASPPVSQTYDYTLAVMSDDAAARIINVDFNGDRNVPGPNSDPLTYVGLGAAGGGRTFNGIAADSRLADGTDNDNLTVGATNLLNSISNSTAIAITVSPVGGDSTAGRTGGNTNDPTSSDALWSDYIFNNSAGNQAGQSPFTISGLGAATSADLYFYKGPGTVTIPGAQPATFADVGGFTAANTVLFRAVPISNGTIAGSFGGGVTVIYGLSVVLASPQIGPLSIARQGSNVLISWPGTGTLQSADQITGAWTDEAGATSPATVSTTAARKFYRLKQ